MNRESRIKVSGRVIKGEGYGKSLGFPTANLDRKDYARRGLKIRFGIYVGIVRILPPLRPLKAETSPPNIGGESKGWYKAGIVIGPLDFSGLPKIEAHLIGFNGSLYGRKLTLYLIKYLRPFKKFDNVKRLKAQIAKDIEIVKNIKSHPLP